MCKPVRLMNVNITILVKTLAFASLDLQRCKFHCFENDCNVHMYQQYCLTIWYALHRIFVIQNSIYILKGQDNWPSEVAIFASFDNFFNVSFISIFCRVCEPALLTHVNITILVKTVEFASLQMEGQFANAVTSTLMALIANKVSQTTFHLQLS